MQTVQAKSCQDPHFSNEYSLSLLGKKYFGVCLYTFNLRVVIEDTEIAEDVVCNAGFVSSNTASHSLLWRAKSLLLGSLFSYSETP